jgi:glycosyltransferase involved in cell wall biosynthesis
MPAAVIVPAHDEERVLARTLETLLRGLAPEVQVLVVPNGCTDRTVEVARSFCPRVEVVVVEQASKVAALNAGDAAARGYPRVYLDADIDLCGDRMARLIEVLESPGALAAEPRAHIELDGCGVLVRAYYGVWLGLHGRAPGDVGCGLYALSEAGRARFGAFPPVISDDGYVRAHFAPGEIQPVEDVYTVVRAPRTLGALLKIKTRSRLGAIELARRYPELWARKRGAGVSMGAKLRRLPWRLWLALPIYVVVQLAVRRRAGRQVADLEGYVWERDESSR